MEYNIFFLNLRIKNKLTAREANTIFGQCDSKNSAGCRPFHL